MLSVLGQDELRSVLFPVGDYPKPEIRRIAAERGLPIASKHDSMDLCFVADDDYRRFLHDWAADAMRPGPMVDVRVRPPTRGLPAYTIGRAKAWVSAAGEPLYVIQLTARNSSSEPRTNCRAPDCR